MKIIPKKVLTDNRLSTKAKGLVGFIINNPGLKIYECSKELDELIEYNYININESGIVLNLKSI